MNPHGVPREGAGRRLVADRPRGPATWTTAACAEFRRDAGAAYFPGGMGG
ncbi:hypothetical protein [Streptomyces sp. cg2]